MVIHGISIVVHPVVATYHLAAHAEAAAQGGVGVVDAGVYHGHPNPEPGHGLSLAIFQCPDLGCSHQWYALCQVRLHSSVWKDRLHAGSRAQRFQRGGCDAHGHALHQPGVHVVDLDQRAADQFLRLRAEHDGPQPPLGILLKSLPAGKAGTGLGDKSGRNLDRLWPAGGLCAWWSTG